MVDLNLNPTQKHKPVSAKSYQTLEQARLQAPKDKVAVLPPPAPVMPVATAPGFYNTHMAAPAGGFYQQPQPQMMYSTGAAGYNSAIVSYGGNFATGAPVQQQQQSFRPGFPPSNAPAFGSDPFATLS